MDHDGPVYAASASLSVRCSTIYFAVQLSCYIHRGGCVAANPKIRTLKAAVAHKFAAAARLEVHLVCEFYATGKC
jgi:hypothetical protein